MLVGTGVACVTKDYGTGADASLGTVEIDPEGRIAIHCDARRDGQRHRHGARQPGGGSPGRRGRRSRARAVDTFGALALVTSGDPYTMDQATQDAAQRNPRWVPAISSATSASIGAHVGTHAAAEAARVIFRFGLWPAALELWRHRADRSESPGNGRRRAGKTGSSIMPGLAPLALPALAAGRMRAIS